jgi:hypothetical protein
MNIYDTLIELRSTFLKEEHYSEDGSVDLFRITFRYKPRTFNLNSWIRWLASYINNFSDLETNSITNNFRCLRESSELISTELLQVKEKARLWIHSEREILYLGIMVNDFPFVLIFPSIDCKVEFLPMFKTWEKETLCELSKIWSANEITLSDDISKELTTSFLCMPHEYANSILSLSGKFLVE